MLNFCMMTMVGNLYLHFHDYDSNGQQPTVAFHSSNPSNWTIDENTSTGAYRICSADYPDWCLGIAEGRQIRDLESVTLQKANSANSIFWKYNRTAGFLQPYGYDNYYLVTMDLERGLNPLQLWGQSSAPTFNYAKFIFKIC